MRRPGPSTGRGTGSGQKCVPREVERVWLPVALLRERHEPTFVIPRIQASKMQVNIHQLISDSRVDSTSNPSRMDTDLQSFTMRAHAVAMRGRGHSSPLVQSAFTLPG